MGNGLVAQMAQVIGEHTTYGRSRVHTGLLFDVLFEL
jgi:hypothetical protein